MEKFNLERALAGEPVITRDGRKVTQLVKFDSPEAIYPLVGVVDGDSKSWTINGKYSIINGDTPMGADLFMKPKENAIWVNIYKDEYGKLYTGGIDYNSEELAKTSADFKYYLRTIKITE
jgi:hypothetical protein